MSRVSGYLSRPFVVWFLGNALGFAVLRALMPVLLALLPSPGLVASILLISIPVSLAQWMALRRILPVSALWMLTIPFGIVVVILIPEGLWHVLGMGGGETVAAMVAGYLVLGLVAGLLQWLLLRRRLSGSSLWLLGSALGPAAGLWLVMVTDLVHQAWDVAFILWVLVYATVTGLALSRLVAHPKVTPAPLQPLAA